MPIINAVKCLLKIDKTAEYVTATFSIIAESTFKDMGTTTLRRLYEIHMPKHRNCGFRYLGRWISYILWISWILIFRQTRFMYSKFVSISRVVCVCTLALLYIQSGYSKYRGYAYYLLICFYDLTVRTCLSYAKSVRPMLNTRHVCIKLCSRTDFVYGRWYWSGHRKHSQQAIVPAAGNIAATAADAIHPVTVIYMAI